MKRIIVYIIIMIILLAVIPVASAKVSVDVQHSPETILVGDTVDYTITLKNKGLKNVKVKSVVFYSRGVEVEPNSISDVGAIAAGSSYELPLIVKTEETGTFTIEMHVRTENGTVKRLIMVDVENEVPKIILTSPLPLRLNEVNKVNFYLTNPVGSIKDVSVEACFDAEPKVIYLGDLTSSGQGTFSYAPENRKNLSFRISYYNGRNHHQVVKTVTPDYRQAKGITVNTSTPYNSVPVQDVVPLDVTISNLRKDTIYSVNVSAHLNDEEKTKKIASLDSKRTSKVSFQFSPQKKGKNTIQVNISYKDELNNKYTATDKVQLFVIKEKPLSFSNIKTEKNIDGTTISGDVSNSGRSKIYNVLLSMQLGNNSKTFYLGSLEASDFNSFEFEFPQAQINASKAILTASWNNELGEKVELSKEIKLPQNKNNIHTGDSNLILIGSVAAIAIIVLVAGIWIKSRK